jgi:hypothetical protein
MPGFIVQASGDDKSSTNHSIRLFIQGLIVTFGCRPMFVVFRRIGGSGNMVSTKQRIAARKNIKKAASAAKRKRTIAHLPKSVRTALGKQASSVAKKKRKSRKTG